MESLTGKVLQYQKTGEGLKTIMDELALRVYHFPRRTMGWDEDACGEFYVFIHPRLLRLVHRFRDQGRPFESYLWTVLNWQLRNFARDTSRREREWNVSLHMEPPDGDGSRCSEASAGESMPRISPELVRAIRSPAEKRNFLFLALKCARFLDPAFAVAAAAVAGVTAGELMGMADELRAMRAARERRLEKFRCRRNKAFARVLFLESELKNEPQGARSRVLQETLQRVRTRMRASVHRMSRVGMSPTNREIAALFGIPKGTVDSGLYWLKRKLAAVYDPDNLRSA